MEPWDKLSPFDQTTLWWLLKKEKDIKVGTFKDNLRWNYYHGYEEIKIVSKTRGNHKSLFSKGLLSKC